MTKLTVAFQNFTNAPKKEISFRASYNMIAYILPNCIPLF